MVVMVGGDGGDGGDGGGDGGDDINVKVTVVVSIWNVAAENEELAKWFAMILK